MRKCKTKAIHADLGIFTRIPGYSGIFSSGIIQAYSEPRVRLAFSELWCIKNPVIFKTRHIFKTLFYPKLWRFRTRDIFRILGYSEPWNI